MSARALVVGLDGADADLVRALGREQLPVLHRCMERGAWAYCESVLPPATLPNWTTFLTGVDPGAHGVFDFTTRRGYQVRFTAGTVRAVPTVAARLDRLGLACACVRFPATYPPERLTHGIFVSGWDAPVAFEADRSFVEPAELWDEIVARFGPPRFDDADEFAADTPGWHARLADLLVGRIEHQTELGLWLLARRSWDLFAFYFGESDTAAHHLWALHDVLSPRHPPGTRPVDRDSLARVYRALDRALGKLLEAAGPDTELTVISDHGSGGAGDKVLYLNRVLAEAGLLAFRPDRAVRIAPWLARLKDLAVPRLPPRVRDRVFRAAGAVLPGWIESRTRFGAIEMTRTEAFSDELNYFPAIHLNVRGREPHGTVDPRDLGRVRDRVREVLLALRDPWTDAPVVAAVHAREDLFRGSHVDRAPDLLLELNLDDGYSYNLMPTASAPRGHRGAWRRLDSHEHLGRKGRSLPGSHRSHGLYVAAGPRVRPAGRISARIADATATLLARLDVAPPPDAAGRVLDILTRPPAGSRDLPAAGAPAPPAPPASTSTTALESRLRALGYID